MNSSGINTPDSSDDSNKKKPNFSDCTEKLTKFKFPPPPRLVKSLNNSYVSTETESSNNSLINLKQIKRKNKRQFTKKLPPMGIYWDIENCQVPKCKNASDIVQKIRELFLKNYCEAEFLVVCDVKKENPTIIQELHNSQVNLIHVSSTSKNAADEKLRQSLRRFAEVYPPPSSVLLISSDINFAADLSDLRYRKKIRVILVHNTNVAEALILCANEHYYYSLITDNLPVKTTKVTTNDPTHLMVTNLPANCSPSLIRNRLNYLTNNCGGRVVDVVKTEGLAFIKFSNQDTAIRAQKRIQGEDVLGNKINVVTPVFKNYAGRKIKNIDSSNNKSSTGSRNFSENDLPQPYFQAIKGNQESSQDGGMPSSIRGRNLSPMDISFGGVTRRRSKTPQETLYNALSANRVHKASASSEYSDDGKAYNSDYLKNNNQSSVDLIISNLDPSINLKDLRKLLINMITEYAMILMLNITTQTDGTPIANIRVNNQHEAQLIISQLHRRKLGHKRIIISYSQNNSPDPEQLSAMIINLLQEVPDNTMPLFKFIEVLEARYHCTVSVSEVNKLKDVCKISEEFGSRVVTLRQEVRTSPPPNLSKTLMPYCSIHCPNAIQTQGWCELNVMQLPNVMMNLNMFAKKLHGLLSSHLGSMPLLSFQACYEDEYRELLPIDNNGVPLEHLISCVSNIVIRSPGLNKNIKIIVEEKTVKSDFDEESILKNMPITLAQNINLLCRELVDLLKTSDKCQILLSKFIPAYHHHFGRQCHVANYGFTKLLDLFESIPHVIQLMGCGTSRIITLSHQAQIRRFTSDLLRVLKVQTSKQINIIDYPLAYEKVMNKLFNPVEYGLCSFEDLLSEVPDNTIVINNVNDNIVIAIPKREQTSDEITRTKQFAVEVIDMLRHSPYCTMLFNKFVPAYHHHFGIQCKVADYGFTKLIELFEAIPDIVKIQELPNGERTISLTLSQSLKILGTQIMSIIKNSNQSSILQDELPLVYLRECGYPLKPEVYDCKSIPELIEKLSDYVQIAQSGAGLVLVSVDTELIPVLKIRTWSLLIKSPYYKEFPLFKYEYESRYNMTLSLNHLQQLRNVVSLSFVNDMNYIALTDLYILIAQIYHIIYTNNGHILLNDLEKFYLQCYGKYIKLIDYDLQSFDDLFNQFNFIFNIYGTGSKTIITLNRNLADYQVPIPTFNDTNLINKNNNDWPPLPVLSNTNHNTVDKKIIPPKPDSPLTPGASALWNEWWQSPTYNDYDLSINLPIIENPPFLADPKDLISPSKTLYPNIIWSKLRIPAPHPMELPMPDKLMSKEHVSDDSTDSGVNSKLENSPSDNEIETASNISRAKLDYEKFLKLN